MKKKSKKGRVKPLTIKYANDFMKRDCERIKRNEIRRIIAYQDHLDAFFELFGLTKKP